ncbi:MAG: hypothetical protein KatS3mg090_0133 [Patescibacteria group bacterium]|nr:MAG: hypothetical protein KatS3mg090_0133 [Patescibacteria group bacterium]
MLRFYNLLTEKNNKGISKRRDEYLEQIFERKRKLGLSIGIIVPTLNVESTVGELLDMIKEYFMKKDLVLVDEVIVVDSGSIDNTKEEVISRGFPFYRDIDIGPKLSKENVVHGKGENMWRGLHVLKSDIVIFMDSDPIDPNPEMLWPLIYPLIIDDNIVFVKSVFNRLTNGDGNFVQTGGRVTEISVRPLLNIIFPELKYIIQPLNGNVAGWKDIFLSLEFPTGYGVETSLLIDIAMKYGVNRIAQVFCGVFYQQGNDLYNLAKMSFRCQNVILKKAMQYGRLSFNKVSSKFYQPLFVNKCIEWSISDLEEIVRPPIIHFNK